MKIKRFFILPFLAIITVATMAQSPEAVLESLRKYPNLAFPEASTYPSIPLGEIAAAPKGFEPFYFSLTGRHGSRYEYSEKYFKSILGVFNKADNLGILTEEGKLLHKKIKEVFNAQQGNKSELAPLGFEQWNGIAERAYKNFGKIFESGSIEAKSSTSLRCVFSMASFNNTIKGKVPSIKISQHARQSELAILRPLKDNPELTEEVDKFIKEQIKIAPWHKARDEWEKSRDCSSFLSKITTNPEALLTKCGENQPFAIACKSFRTIIFAENLGLGDREMVNRLFTAEELYGFYVSLTAKWVNGSIGVGNLHIEAIQSYMRPLVEDIINKAEDAIKGENPNTANLRFTHDSFMGPLFSIIGYEGCVPHWNENLELATTSFNFGTVVPMAANLQIVLYRNKKGEVLVRSLVNEKDAYLPIECKTAPFYPWKDFCAIAHKHMAKNDIALEKFLTENNLK